MRVIIPDLAPGTTYNLQFRSLDGNGNFSDWSRLFTLTTTADNVAPQTPTGLALVVSGSSFKASWNAVTLSADSSNAYDLAGYYLKVESPLDPDTRIIATTNTSYEIPFELNRSIFGSPVGSVTVSVAAYDRAGNVSPYSSTVNAVNPAPTQPANFVANGVTDGISMKWDTVADSDLMEYRIYYGTTAGFTPAPANLVWSGQANTAVVRNTSYATDGYYKLASVDVFGTPSTYASAGPVRPNSPFAVDSTAPGTPTGLAATLANSTDESYAIATVSWTAVTDTDGDLSEYIIGYRPVGATDWQYAKVDYTNTSTKINGLLPYTNYDFRIRSSDFSANLSAWSTTVTATGSSNTAPSTPSAPTATAGTMQIQVVQANTKAAGGAMEGDVVSYEIYASTTTGFTPSSSTQIGVLDVGPAMVGTFYLPASNSSGSTQTWYVKSIAVDRGGLKSAASAQATAATGLIATANISDLAVTSAKINDLAANKITAGTGIINDLSVKAKLTLGDASTVGSIESYGYVAGSTGFHFDKNLLEINQGSISAAALKIQASPNIMKPEYANMEATGAFYDLRTYRDYAFVAVDSSQKRFGSQSLKQTWFTGGAGQRSTVWYTDGASNYNIDVDPSTTYIVSAWTRTTSTPAMNYQLLVKESTGITTAVANVTHDVTGSWMRYYGTITTSATTYQIMVGTSFDASLGNGDVYIDGIQVEQKMGALTTPAPWKPPGVSSIDGGIIRTGEIRSNSTVTVNETSQPAWSIDMEGDAQFGNALVRGKVIVGLASEPPANRAAWNGDAEANLGTAGYTLYSVGATTPALTRTTTVGEVISGTASYKVSAAAGTKTSLGLYTDTQDFTTGTSLTVEFYYTTDGTGDMVVDFHDGTSTVIQSTTVATSVPTGTLLFGTATVNVPDSQTVRRIYIYETGSITTTSLIIDNIYIHTEDQQGQSYISSGNFIEGSSGWKVDSSGNAEFNSGIFRGSLGANTVDANALTSDLVISSNIRTAASGKRIEFTPDALRLYDTNNDILINFPTDDITPASFYGDLYASSLIVADNLAIRGSTNEISPGAQVALATSVTAPSTKPTISVDWQFLSTRNSAGFADSERWGLAYNGGYFYMFQDSFGENASIKRYSATTGAPDNSFKLMTTISHGYGGLTIFGGNVWVLGQDASNNYWYVEGYNMTTWAKVATRWLWSSTSTHKPTIGNDGTNILIASQRYSGYTDKIAWARYTTSGTYVASSLVGTTWVNTVGVGGIFWGTADLGSTNVIIWPRSQAAGALYYTTSGTLVSSGWPNPSYVTPSGACWDGTNFWTHDASIGNLTKHSGIMWSGTESSTWWVSETWYDPDATGGTHETTQGPRTSFTMKRRSYLTITSPRLPIRPVPNTTDDATQGRFFIGRGSTDPGRARMEYNASVTSAALSTTLSSVTIPTGTNPATVAPPSTNNFPTATPGQIVSVAGNFLIKGDGSGTWGQMTVSTTGVSTFSGTSWAPDALATGSFAGQTIAAGGSGSSNITFPSGRFTSAPLVFVSPSSGRLNYSISSVTTSGATIGWNNWTSASSSGGTTYWVAIQF